MVHVDKCLRCGQPGSMYWREKKCGKPNCKCASGLRESLHSQLVVQHYVDYNPEHRTRRTRICHISLRRLDEHEKARVISLKKKYMISSDAIAT